MELEIAEISIYCPGCGSIKYPTRGPMVYCERSDCKMYGRRFQIPERIELMEIMPEAETDKL